MIIDLLNLRESAEGKSEKVLSLPSYLLKCGKGEAKNRIHWKSIQEALGLCTSQEGIQQRELAAYQSVGRTRKVKFIESQAVS